MVGVGSTGRSQGAPEDNTKTKPKLCEVIRDCKPSTPPRVTPPPDKEMRHIWNGIKAVAQWTIDHPAIVGLGLAAGCLIPLVGWVGCAALGAGAIVLSGVHNYMAAGGFNGRFWKAELIDVTVAAAIFMGGGAFWADAVEEDAGLALGYTVRSNSFLMGGSFTVGSARDQFRNWNRK